MTTLERLIDLWKESAELADFIATATPADRAGIMPYARMVHHEAKTAEACAPLSVRRQFAEMIDENGRLK